ncbi:acyl-phosphate glycerol 3-phosphate acyltransferase [Sphingomonas sp. Leaf33]|uniref:lysophospholipid acyltransferase family protein n=1 Tax=Sphingomonas sp. Leaf33 TaxID=1736215 RepID=UPI0006F51B2F|nr:lysophospholipid acyltransferase family protein [Sphingomonas sp. Leaf33]KQN24887.1 acyl-phosphate glycerol 3-phosphate acyltransferase [Sphingomonas sp. Leaf33]
MTATSANPRYSLAANFRFATRLAGIALALILALPFHGLWRLFRLSSPWPMYFLAAVAWIIGARRHTIGRSLTRDVVFLSNHLSWLDIPLLAGRNGTAFVAKSDLEKVPVIGWLCGLNRTLFVDRTARMSIADQIAELRDALAEVWSITIFAEGTTGDGQTLLPFKPALLAVLDPPPPGVRVQPVLIDYGTAMADIAWLGDEPGAVNARRVLSRRGTFTATLTFLEPFDPAGLAGRKAVAAEARARMLAA